MDQDNLPLINIAIVEDDDADAKLLENSLREIVSLLQKQVSINRFATAESFLANYTPSYDIVFMDIELGEASGLEACKVIRQKDESVIIIFTTNMRQFALEGYSVSALDYLIKPIRKERLASALERALSRLENKKKGEVLLKTSEGLRKVAVDSIRFIETQNHRVIVHLKEEVIDYFGTMKAIVSVLSPTSFALCNSGYLVNLAYVTTVRGESVYIGTEELKISRSKKKTFMASLLAYLGDK
ncbi:MAG: response regulator transcription factor [Bacilli bacterium]|nr:response regulator transcription factor [Bacilli bacterium]